MESFMVDLLNLGYKLYWKLYNEKFEQRYGIGAEQGHNRGSVRFFSVNLKGFRMKIWGGLALYGVVMSHRPTTVLPARFWDPPRLKLPAGSLSIPPEFLRPARAAQYVRTGTEKYSSTVLSVRNDFFEKVEHLLNMAPGWT